MKRFAKAIALFSAGSVIGTLTQVAKGKLGAILLGAEGVGVLNQLTNAWNLLFSAAGLGFYNGVVRRIAEADASGDNQALARQLSTSLIFLTAVSCVGAALGVLLSTRISQWIFVDDGAHARLVAITLASVPFAIAAQTYKGLLSGCKKVKPIVSAQVVSDVLGLGVFVVLVYAMDLTGAVLAFSALHLLKLALQIVSLRRALPGVAILPRPGEFAWSEVGINVGYGINGLFMVSVGVFTMVLVSRWIIDAQGLAANGVFSVAWKVASVYFGALYASASSFYFPTLVACRDDDELGARINEAISLYFFLLPPVIVGLMVAGEDLMFLLFSREFAPAAFLLLYILPGDLFRVLAEAMGMAFLARRRLIPYTLTYVLWAASFLALARWGLDARGLFGVALAYLVAQVISAAAVYACARRSFSFRLSRPALRTIALGMGVVAAASLMLVAGPAMLWRYGTGAAILALWLVLAWLDPGFRDLAEASWNKLLRTRKGAP